MLSLSILLITIIANPIEMITEITYEAPDHDTYFLQDPRAFDLDSDGNMYLLDGEAQVIFSWDKTGAFRKIIGKPGQGPGEFTFTGHGSATGFVYSLGDKLYVFDGFKRSVLIFDKDGHFIGSPNLNLPRSRTQSFVVLDEDRFLLTCRRFKDDKLVQVTKEIDQNGNDIKIYTEKQDDAITFKGGKPGQKSGSRPTGMIVKAYNPKLVVGYNADNGNLAIGHSKDLSIEIYDRKGHMRQMQLAIPQRDVTDFDKSELEESRSKGRSGFVQFVFSEKMPYYMKLVPLKDGKILAYHETPFSHKIDGTVFDNQGTPVGKVKMECGEGGGLLSARGKLLRCSLNEDDEFELTLLSLGKIQ
ncbi:MAG: hypothetical protein CR997_05485 [Acidobacteria bacterium]|nr:MAG: hypothetical protein CR997_05485 [Acidobacteriota bacterium]